MAALTNLTIFSTKPMFSALRYKIKQIRKRRRSSSNQNNFNQNNNNQNNSNQNSDEYDTRSTSVYKKPYFKWRKPTDDSTQLIQLQASPQIQIQSQIQSPVLSQRQSQV